MWFYLALLSAFFNALVNVARRTHGSLAQPAELAWWTLLLSFPLNLGFVLISKQPLWTSTDFILPVILAGCLNSYGGVLLFRAYKYGDVSAVSPLANFIPVAVVVTSFIMLGLSPSWAGLAGILLVVGGVYYSSVTGKQDLMHPLRLVFKHRASRTMLLWVCLMAVSTVFIKTALSSASPAFLMVGMITVEFTVLSLYMIIFRPYNVSLKHGELVMARWGWHIAAISVFGALSVFFQLHAMNLADPSYVLSAKRLDVLMTILLAGFFLKEKHLLKRFEGSVIALAGVVIIFIAG